MRNDVAELIRREAVFYLSHSGGKDSQAMYARVTRQVPTDQIVVVHADLGKVEWHGVQDHIRKTIRHPLNVVRARKTFFDMVRHRARRRPEVPSFPSSGSRQCTSDLKRGPIYKFIRNDMRARGARLGVNCMGLRAEESSHREKLPALTPNPALTTLSREVHNWLPVHRLTTAEVFEEIRRAGQEPFWAYRAGNTRLSCVFCILACSGDLANGRRHRPELYEEYRRLERETGWTMFAGQSLEERSEGRETAAAGGHGGPGHCGW